MMRIGIVGSEQAKFTPQTEQLARQEIRALIAQTDLVVSGECHLGGADIFAHQEADQLGVPFLPCPPRNHHWTTGYMPRNLKIVAHSDLLACVTVKQLPAGYRGMRFPQGCYHCKTPPEHHVKSGGCWTMRRAALDGRKTLLVVVSELGVERFYGGQPTRQLSMEALLET